MKISFKHIGFLLGVGLTFVSFLFFGRQQNIYQILLLGGLVTGLVFYLTILFGKGDLKTKVVWTVVVVLSTVVLRVVEPFLIDTSYRFYICRNRSTLAEINNILLHKQSDITIINDSISKSDDLTIQESNKLREAQKKLDVYIISKSDSGIYYGLWGFLDIRLGIAYLTNIKPDNRYRHLTGNWFW